MAWRNIWRHPRRTALTIAAIAFATALLVFMVSFQFGAIETMINSSVKIRTGHLQVQAENYREKRDMRLVVPDPAAVGAIFVVGIDPEREAAVSTLKKTIRQGAYLSEGDADGALVGELLARNLKVGPGDELTVMGQGRDGSVAATLLKVKGIYKSGLAEFDRSSIHITLKNFQETYSMRGAVHEVVAIGASLKDIPAVKAAVERALADASPDGPLAVLDWRELAPGLYEVIMINMASRLIFYLILVIVVASSISNTFLMALFERTREFGVMMAIGTARRRLTRILLLESVNITLIGVAVGIIMGSLAVMYFEMHGLDLSGSEDLLSQFGISGRIYPRLSLFSASAGPALVFAITFLAALYPALRIRRLQPVEAMAHA